MKRTKFTLSFAALLLSASFLHAELIRTEISQKAGWTVNSVADDDGKVVRTEMVRTYDGKQEVHLRISFDGENFHIDSSADWSEIPDAKSHAAEYRIDSAANESAWNGKAKVIKEADGMTWLRITEPNEPGVGDGISNGKKLFIYVGAIGESVEWNFDLKGSNAAYKTMVDRFLNAESETEERTPSPCTGKSSHFNKLTEHDYARPGDWAVHYFTDKRGKFACASMIRYYDNGTMLRVSRDNTHLHVDARGDWNLLKGASKDISGNIVVTLASDASPDDDSLKYEGTVIDEGGDKWLRISQSYEEPGGLADVYRNSESLRLKFTKTKYWSFNLKGSHAADVKMDECIAKYKK